MAANSAIAKLVYEIRIPILLAMGWMLLGILSSQVVPESPVVDAISISVRIGIAAYAGFLVTFRRKFGLFGAAVAGAIVNFAEHVLVKGGAFLVIGEFAAAGGVAISFVMFFWVAMTISFLGGMLGIALRPKHAAI